MSEEQEVGKPSGQSLFDAIRHIDKNGEEYWLARELAEALDYTSWQSFEGVIARAKISIAESGQAVENHFKHLPKMVSIGYGNDRPVDDIRLTRYACYIIAQNGSAAKKPAVALAQSYFAQQTRKQELVDRRNDDMERLIARHQFTESDKRFSDAVMDKDMSSEGLARIKSSGDQVMFGGKSTNQMKREYGILDRKTPLANRMPNVVLAAKSLANEMTAENLANYPIDTFDEIQDENNENNLEVRKALGSRGIVPEELPPAEDTAKIMKRVLDQDKNTALDE